MNILGLIIICLTIYWIVEEICSYLKEKNRNVTEVNKATINYRGMDKIAEEICREE